MIGSRFRERYLDVLASIYLYNEHRGYTSLDRVLDAVRQRCPDDAEFQAEIAKHRADEEKHYRMFRRWFERQGRMPLQVDSGVGHIDRFIQWVFRCSIEELDTSEIVGSEDDFVRLCRVIMLTEQRLKPGRLLVFGHVVAQAKCRREWPWRVLEGKNADEA